MLCGLSGISSVLENILPSSSALKNFTAVTHYENLKSDVTVYKVGYKLYIVIKVVGTK